MTTSIERRVSALEGPGHGNPYSHLSDADLDSEIHRSCVRMGTTLEAEIERHGSEEALLRHLKRELAAQGIRL
jgi:hypothetical protein